MSVCMRSLLAFVLIILSPIRLNSPMFLLSVHNPLFPPEYSLDAPSDNRKICDFKVYLGPADKMFTMLGGNVDNFLPLGYFCGYDSFPRSI